MDVKKLDFSQINILPDESPSLEYLKALEVTLSVVNGIAMMAL